MPRTRKRAAKADSPPVDEKKQKEEEEEEPDKSEEDEAEQPEEEQEHSTIYEFKAKTIKGEELSLEKYKDHVCIIVNVASKCGHTKSNYEQLVKLYDKYADKGLKILAFPCNQFGSQEPADNEKICEFAGKKNVKFDMFEKVDVNGKDAHPLWKFLTGKIADPKPKKGKNGKDIAWNFTKFIVNKEGVPIERHASAVKPLTLVDSLEKLWE